MAATAKKAKAKTKAKAKSVNLQPLGERIVVRREESLDTTAGGIFPVSYTHLTLPTILLV